MQNHLQFSSVPKMKYKSSEYRHAFPPAVNNKEQRVRVTQSRLLLGREPGSVLSGCVTAVTNNPRISVAQWQPSAGDEKTAPVIGWLKLLTLTGCTGPCSLGVLATSGWSVRGGRQNMEKAPLPLTEHGEGSPFLGLEAPPIFSAHISSARWPHPGAKGLRNLVQWLPWKEVGLGSLCPASPKCLRSFNVTTVFPWK